MAVAVWVASTAYSVGNIRRATTTQASGLVFRCTTAGTSASSEPDWPTDIGSTLVDGSVTWTAVSSIYEDISVLAPNTVIELFELHLDNSLHGSTTVYRWHNNNTTANITWNSATYVSQPIMADGFEATSGGGTLPRPTLSVGNADRTITAILLTVNETTEGNDLGGALVKRIRTLKKYLDGESAADPFATWPEERWYVDRKVTETKDIVTFELASKLDLPGVKVPKRQVIGNLCQWAYRSSECSYTGTNYWKADDTSTSNASEDQCGKRLSSCKLRFGANSELPFGSFPGAGAIR
jgi:lambda family phage minor tail protein L